MPRLRDLGTVLLVLGAAAPSAAAAANFGNPAGHFPVPAAGRTVSTARPDHVVGKRHAGQLHLGRRRARRCRGGRHHL